jgi:agmatine/peptidylarginine deiminase
VIYELKALSLSLKIKDIMDISHHNDFFLPAEWFPQSGIQLTWPHAGTDWLPYLDDITKTFCELARTIATYEKVLIVSPDIDLIKKALSNVIPSQLQHRLRYCQCDTDDTWTRDHGAITLISDKGKKMLLDFQFNGWGKKFPAQQDNAISRRLFDGGFFIGEMENHEDFVLEGGSIESDGKGTVFTTSQCLLAPNRNQPLTQSEIEGKLKETLRAERIVWLDYGNLRGDDTDGHIDTIVRTAPDDTLLYIGCDNHDDEQYEDFLMLEKQLRGLRTTAGAPYTLMRLPMPDAIYDDGYRLPATYANFVILNDAVICPTYHQPKHDEAAIDTIRKAFPGREVIGIDALTVIRQHGSLHCLTMQYPLGTIK